MWTRLFDVLLLVTLALADVPPCPWEAASGPATETGDGLVSEAGPTETELGPDEADPLVDSSAPDETQASQDVWEEMPEPCGEEGRWLVAEAAGGCFADGQGSVRMPVAQAADNGMVHLLVPECTFEGMRLCGWWTSDGATRVADGSSEILDAGPLEDAACMDVTDDIVLVARWEPVRYRQVVRARFQDADGSFGEPTEILSRDCELGEEVCWELPADDVYEGASVCFEVAGETSREVDVLRRSWTLVLAGEGCDERSFEVLVGSQVDLGEHACQREDMCLVGWEWDGARIDAGARVCDLARAGESAVLHAVWERCERTVTFCANAEDDEVTGAVEDIRLASGEETVSLPGCAFTRRLHVFRGWSQDADGSSGVFGAGEQVAPSFGESGEATFYALWEPCQIEVSVPVALEVAVGADGELSGQAHVVAPCVDGGVVVLESVEATQRGPWRLVGAGQEPGPDEFSLTLALPDGRRVEVGESGEAVGVGEPLAGSGETTIVISGRIGASSVAEANFCRLRWAFRVEPRPLCQEVSPESCA